MPFDHDEILKKAMEDQPLLMKIFGPDLMTGEQKEKIEEAVSVLTSTSLLFSSFSSDVFPRNYRVRKKY